MYKLYVRILRQLLISVTFLLGKIISYVIEAATLPLA